MEEFLKKCGLSNAVGVFERHQIEVDQLNELTGDLIKELLPMIGDRLKLIKGINERKVRTSHQPKKKVGVKRRNNKVAMSRRSIKNDPEKKACVLQILRNELHVAELYQNATKILKELSLFSFVDGLSGCRLPNWSLIDFNEGSLNCILCTGRIQLQTRERKSLWNLGNYKRHFIIEHGIQSNTKEIEVSSFLEIEFNEGDEIKDDEEPIVMKTHLSSSADQFCSNSVLTKVTTPLTTGIANHGIITKVTLAVSASVEKSYSNTLDVVKHPDQIEVENGKETYTSPQREQLQLKLVEEKTDLVSLFCQENGGVSDICRKTDSANLGVVTDSLINKNVIAENTPIDLLVSDEIGKVDIENIGPLESAELLKSLNCDADGKLMDMGIKNLSSAEDQYHSTTAVVTTVPITPSDSTEFIGSVSNHTLALADSYIAPSSVEEGHSNIFEAAGGSDEMVLEDIEEIYTSQQQSAVTLMKEGIVPPVTQKISDVVPVSGQDNVVVLGVCQTDNVSGVNATDSKINTSMDIVLSDEICIVDRQNNGPLESADIIKSPIFTPESVQTIVVTDAIDVSDKNDCEVDLHQGMQQHNSLELTKADGDGRSALSDLQRIDDGAFDIAQNSVPEWRETGVEFGWAKRSSQSTFFPGFLLLNKKFKWVTSKSVLSCKTFQPFEFHKNISSNRKNKAQIGNLCEFNKANDLQKFKSIKMSVNSLVDLSVGSVVQMDNEHGFEVQRGVWIAQTLQFEDIYLTESEDFWQEQQLDCDKQLFEFIAADESPASVRFSLQQSPCCGEISTSKQKSTVPFEEFLTVETPTGPMNEIEMIDPPGMSSEMIGAPSNLASMCFEQTPSEIADERPMHEIEMRDLSAYVTDTSIEEPVGSVFQEENETSSTSEIEPMQPSSVRIGSVDTPTFQDRLVFQYTTVEQSIMAKPKRSCDNTKMFVRSSTDKKTKQLCCPFCLVPFSKLARHMESQHKNEVDVAKFVNLPKHSKERRFIQDSLRKAGTHIWNSDPSLNKNELIPSRRPNENSVLEAIRWTTCPYCLGSYTKNNLRHHVAGCPVKKLLNPDKDQRILTKLATIVEARIHGDASDRLVNVMGFMREDEVVRLVRFDWLLIVFGNKMCCKYTPHYQENMIRARLRLAGRVLNEIKKIDPSVTDFAAIYHVEHYPPLVSAIRNIGRFDPLTSEFGAPAMASFAVTFIKIIGKYLSAEYIRLRDRENKMETEDFLTYMDTDIDISINKLVAETQAKMRRRKQKNIPTMEDVKKLIRHINVERNLYFEKLSETYSDDNWLKLTELSMAWIIVFNRRRVGEVQNILLEEFLVRESIDDDSNQQMLATLSAEAKTVAKKFKRMKIRGKKGRTVPVLLKPAIDKGIQLLIDTRQMAGVSADSQYLFQLPSTSNTRIRVVDACRVLRDLSLSCGATNPSSLGGTTLRKHMATTCISLELNDALVSEVADFMGHAEKIHREFYRQNTIDREVVQMAQLLELAAGKCDSDDEDDDIGNGGLINADTSSTNDATNVRTETADDEMMFERNLDESQVRVPMGGGKVHVGAETKKCTRVRWTEEEISCVKELFAGHFKKRTLPAQAEIESQQEDNPILGSRTWQQIKAYINNQQKKGTRK